MYPLGLMSERFTTYGIALGPRTKKASSSLNIFDVLGRGDVDTLIMKPRGIEVAITMPHTLMSPNGYLRLPLDLKNPLLVIPKMFNDVDDPELIAPAENKQLEFFNTPYLEQAPFVFAARELWIMLSDLHDRKAIRMINTDAVLSPHKTTYRWRTDDDPEDCEAPISKKEAREIQKKLDTDLIPVLQSDSFLAPYLELMVNEMAAIADGSYR